jgi:hypothetical protein
MDMLRHSNLSPVMMEVLQILEFIYRNDRLSFTDDLISTEQELSVIDVSADVVKDLLSQGKVDKLVALVESSLDGAHSS